MGDGAHGYNISTAYTSYFFREMAPDWLDFCSRANGFDAQRRGPSYRYLDLGCGQGFHLCVLAAANPEAQFVGIDFQPELMHRDSQREGKTLAGPPPSPGPAAAPARRSPAR